MNNIFFKLIDAPTRLLLRSRFFNSLTGFMAYQRKRVIRNRVEAKLRAQGVYGDEVERGPFRGLKYPPLERWASARFQKIIGAYEHELHPLVERLAATKSYRTIYNVGAAEGFYSMGLARLFPQARLLSFESQPDKQAFCDDLATINGVSDRIEKHGTCTAEGLDALHPDGPALVWMDIDTGERPVLDPTKVPWLRQSDILVELHDCLEAGLSELIRGRFTDTHRIERLTLRGLDYDKFSELQNLSFVEINAMVEEDRRGLQDWFFMEPLA